LLKRFAIYTRNSTIYFSEIDFTGAALPLMWIVRSLAASQTKTSSDKKEKRIGNAAHVKRCNNSIS